MPPLGYDEFKSGNLTLRAGFRYNIINNHIDLISGGNPGEQDRDFNILIWNAGIKYRLNETINIYGNAGNSFIAPGLKSIGGTIRLEDKGIQGKNGQLPNSDLKPENGLGLDLGTDISLLNKINNEITLNNRINEFELRKINYTNRRKKLENKLKRKGNSPCLFPSSELPEACT